MPKASNPWNSIPAALAALLCSLILHSDSLPVEQSRMTSLPHITLWAWERREDLHAIDTTQFAVAYLDRTVTIGETVRSQPRRDAVFFPAAATRIPVVRIEVTTGATLTGETRSAVVSELLSAAEEPGIAALQVDFDATRSQRAFYRELLTDLRKKMPARLPLSITALASWCSYDDWLHGLPIDEAVPMLFRMEPDRRRAPSDLSEFQIREPLCRTSRTNASTSFLITAGAPIPLPKSPGDFHESPQISPGCCNCRCRIPGSFAHFVPGGGLRPFVRSRGVCKNHASRPSGRVLARGAGFVTTPVRFR